jgi:hypothetical protein
MGNLTALLKKPTLGHFLYFKMLTIIPLFIAFLSIVRYSTGYIWILTYFLLLLLHLSIMYSIKCPHCPYYKNGKRTFSCFIYWNMPKLWRERATPASRFVKFYAPIGMAYLSLYPVYWIRNEWELLLIYVLSMAALVASIVKNECSKCLYFECGNNTAPEFLRKACLEPDDVRKKYLHSEQ